MPDVSSTMLITDYWVYFLMLLQQKLIGLSKTAKTAPYLFMLNFLIENK